MIRSSYITTFFPINLHRSIAVGAVPVLIGTVQGTSLGSPARISSLVAFGFFLPYVLTTNSLLKGWFRDRKICSGLSHVERSICPGNASFCFWKMQQLFLQIFDCLIEFAIVWFSCAVCSSWLLVICSDCVTLAVHQLTKRDSMVSFEAVRALPSLTAA